MSAIPYDTAAEAGALGCVLSANGDAIRLLEQLRENDFHDLRHKEVFRGLLSLKFDNSQIDVVSLVQFFKDAGRLESVGGFQYLTTLPDQTPSVANFPSFLETVKDRAERRRLITEAKELQAKALDLSKPVQSAISVESLEHRRFNPAIEPPPLRTIYSLAGTTISTPGNLSTMNAQIKAGKSAAIDAMVASTMAQDPTADLLGFSSSNPKALAVCKFDTEQSPDDFWHGNTRAIKRARLTTPPPWFHAYSLTGLACRQSWEFVVEALKMVANRHGGIHSILIDGVADLVADVNDPAECNDRVATFHGMAIKYDCPFVLVIHFNPGTEKSRGHLGSQLERKAETNLALEKDADETTVIYSTKNRRAGIPKNRGPRFAFSVDAGMHVSVASRESAKDAAARESLTTLALDAYNGRPSMRSTELQTTVKKLLTVSDKTAERRVNDMKRLTVIKKSVAGLYVITQPASALP